MLASKLAMLRKQKKWSLQTMANHLGVAKSTYAGYESGYREPSLEILRAIASLHGVSTDYLLDRAGPVLRQETEPEEWEDPELGLWFKELRNAPEERRRELKQIWEMIKQRESGRKPGMSQGEQALGMSEKK